MSLDTAITLDPTRAAGDIAAELSLGSPGVGAVIELIDGGATVPFIARYRKEITGSLDEVAIRSIRDRLAQLRALFDRRRAILKSLKDAEKLTPDLKTAVEGAATLAALEDVYLPHRPKRRTKGTMARERGLEPLAEAILAQGGLEPDREAEKFVDPEKEVADVEAALAGARHIIAEKINEDGEVRRRLRALYANQGFMSTKLVAGQEEAGAKYRDYFEWSEPLKSAPSHRVLAARRGAKEGFLSLSIAPPLDLAQGIIHRLFVADKGRAVGPDSEQVRQAGADAFKRLLSTSLQTEMRLEAKKLADGEAIAVFADNLGHLLLAAPLGASRVLALDPGFRTGCKLACLSAQGELLHHTVIQPFRSQGERERAGQTVRKLTAEYDIQAIAVGNGTASRESMAFLAELNLDKAVAVVMVNESGASVYSASETARAEFPDLDATVRGTVSIGRRLMDPLAELVKIDPKAIGVGQYQHDVDQTALKNSLDDVVVSCVNKVGVEVNTASGELLSYVSGLGPALAKSLVAFREEQGPLTGRKQLLKVPRLGPKAFEQAAGFLRIQGGANPLDASAVHPESYHVVEAMARDLGCGVDQLLADGELRKRIDLEKYIGPETGLPTLKDIMAELNKPGRDPRDRFETFAFAEGINEISDLQPGLKLPGVVTNVTNFGAFVDIGVHTDGLVHISQLADRFVRDPRQEVKVGQQVEVTVLEVDLKRKRISLSRKKNIRLRK